MWAKPIVREPLNKDGSGLSAGARMTSGDTSSDGAQARDGTPEGVVFSLQGLVGFTAGGLLAIVFTLSFGLYASEWVAVAGRVLGFAAGGAIGGAALGAGLRPGSWKSGAVGFGSGFILPALLAGGALTELFGLRIEYNSNSFALTVLAFAASYGLAAAFGGSFLHSRLWLPVGLRFFVAAAVGGLIAASGPVVAGDPSSYSEAGVIGGLAVVFTGHMAACGLAGWLAGLAIESDVKARTQPRPRRRQRTPRSRTRGQADIS